jgi:ketol-acid reductoisomerase
MHQMLKDIETGVFAKEWMDEADNGMQKLNEMREVEGGNQLQTIGDELRKLFVR